MAELLIVVPVLGRPHRVAPFVDAAKTTDASYEILFVCSPDDREQIRECERSGHWLIETPWRPDETGDFARKANLALGQSDEPWLFVVGDDVVFGKNWFSRAMARNPAGNLGVVGTNDLGNPRVMSGAHATHSLVARWYAERYGTVTERPAIFHEGYDHNFVDDELVATARARQSFVFAPDSHVQHVHPNWGGEPWDDTYEKGQRRFRSDAALFMQRQHLWSPQAGLEVARP